MIVVLILDLGLSLSLQVLTPIFMIVSTLEDDINLKNWKLEKWRLAVFTQHDSIVRELNSDVSGNFIR